jgi:hypothetical protein
MLTSLYSHPWKHAVVDNFLSVDEIRDLIAFCDSELNLDDLTSDKNVDYFCRGNQLSFSLPEKILLPKVRAMISSTYHQLDYNNRRRVPDGEIHITLSKKRPGFANPNIHPDMPNKLFSSILYLYPDHGDGTEIYEHRHNLDPVFVKKVPWKQNRVLCFIPQNNLDFPITLHNYKNNGMLPRLTINLMLVKPTKTIIP